MIDFLFIIDDEVSRRSINPVLDLFINHGFRCGIVANRYSVKYMQQYSDYFTGENASKNLSCKFVISGNPIPKGYSKGRRVSIPHGAMFGNSAYSLLRSLHCDIYFGISSSELPYIRHHLKEKFDEEKFYASGCPHNDHLINLVTAKKEHKSKARTLLGLEGGKKTILLSSHWSSIGNLRRFGTGLLDALIWNFPNHQIVCTCHPKLLTSPKGEFLINRNVQTPHFEASWLIKSLKSREGKQVKVILNEKNSSELLFLSDIFIGDNSSMLVEASIFQMPLIKSAGRRYFDKSIENIISSDTYLFSNIEELVGAVKDLENSDYAKVKNGREIRGLFGYNIGSAAKTIFDTLSSML